jgi:DNA-binding MarR family transcriptional regulator
MSRGLGDLQRRVCEVLYAAGDGELPLRELRRRLGDPDRSNLRRAIRGLLERGMVEESDLSGEQRVALEVWTYIAMGDRPAFLAVRPDPTHGGAGRPGGAAEDAPEHVRRRPLPGRPGRPGWFRYEPSFARDRPLGETQGAILGALHRYAKPPQEGLPVTSVKTLVGADRSNLRRAIRTLLLRGLLEESEGGERVRLSPSGVLAASSLP